MSKKKHNSFKFNVFYPLLQFMSILLSIFAGIYSAYTISSMDKNLKSISEVPIEVAFSLIFIVVWTLIFRVSTVAISAHEQKKLVEEFQELLGAQISLENAVNQSLDATYIGSGSEALGVIRSKLQRADEVKNTLVGVLVNDTYEGDVIAMYDAFFRSSKSCIWKDLVSYAEVFSPRFSMKLPYTIVQDRHRVNVLRHSIPLVNALITSEKGIQKCVFFGWMGDHPQNSQIFKSEDPRLIKLFDDHFENLWKTKSVTVQNELLVDYRKMGTERLVGLDIVDKAGRWLTVACVADEGQKEGALESYGIVDIEFIGKKLSIKGQIFDDKLQEKNSVNAREVLDSMTRVTFEYTAGIGDKPRVGFCVYNFYQDEGGGSYINGFFVNNIQRRRKDLVGIKIGNTNLDTQRKDDLKKALLTHGDDLKNMAIENIRHPFSSYAKNK